MNSFTRGNITGQIVTAPGGIEISLSSGISEIGRFTLFEAEQFVHEFRMLVSSARAQQSARARMSGLPLRKP